jgi:hypothetical protein
MELTDILNALRQRLMLQQKSISLYKQKCWLQQPLLRAKNKILQKHVEGIIDNTL